MSQFVHLHLHTDYSMLDGACDVEKLCQRVKEMGMPAVAMTDHGNIFGAVHFVNAAKHAGVKPIVGCELYICKKDDHRLFFFFFFFFFFFLFLFFFFFFLTAPKMLPWSVMATAGIPISFTR